MRSPRRIALLIGLAVVLVAVLAGVVLVVRGASGGGTQASPTTAYTNGGNPATVETNSAAAERDAAEERVRAAIGEALTTQSVALLTGDKGKFVSLADAEAELVAPWLTDRFTSLRALGITRWSPTVSSITETGTARWSAVVDVDYCFADPCPRSLNQPLHTMWNLGDPAGPRLTEIYPGRTGRTAPPWTQSVLKALAGNRVVVAATAANAGRMSATLADAEAAAGVADRFGGDVRPGKYVIYLAGDKEWGKWPYGDEGRWVAGYAQPESESTVVRLSALGTIGLGALLRHELTHVASLAGRSVEVPGADGWWLTEGLAEYATSGDQPFTAYPRRAETATFVRSVKGDLNVGGPAAKSSARDASARYGAAYLGVQCLFQTYGAEKTMTFFHAVAVNGTSLSNTAPQVLGTPWPDVSSTCTARIRRLVGP
ncbi:hypothetical protein GCM10010172_81180 [Paractinoplanes ferrugineus]|uniref:Peptidase MA superfamily protein n=1 Tax=Paractinoplanes ferrugineus TaxID=113564 RepID=A0A919IYD4_9ACTN|nr:hypothetical protein Afe05nite_22790 [Actinoplanes ferrugineus]